MDIRNFCIIAHIDHGKSTLADRMLEITGTKEKREMKNEQFLDTMELEQERGITIKLTPVRMNWKGVQLNLIDTPGHVDFQYEVSRSLASVEGAILIIDATQGIEAQTLSNLYIAMEHDLTVIPVVNKIDLPSADVEKVSSEIISLLGCKKEDIVPISAKTGENVESVLDAIADRVPSPRMVDTQGNIFPFTEDKNQNTVGLIFDSQYDPYKGVVIYVKLFSGEIKKGSSIEFVHTGKKAEALEVGYFSPQYTADTHLWEWQIGYIVTGLRTIHEAQVGDTVFLGKKEEKKAIPGFQKVTPFVYAGVYPVDTQEYNIFKDAVEKLTMNDSALSYENEVSPALGHGFRCGFLGLLHMDIVKERLWREFNIDVIITSPQVTYKVFLEGNKSSENKRLEHTVGEFNGKIVTKIFIKNPEDLPEPGTYIHIEEPIVKIEILTPTEYIGNLMQLAQERRGIFKNQSFLDSGRVILSYELPMAELIGDFYDELKSLSSGYASLSYEFIEYRKDDLVKVDILVAGERMEALSFITHRDKAFYVGNKICKKLKETLPRALFSIAIQAAIGSKVIARETLSALRKDVTGYLYGGDVSRKKKLLEKQKKGKKKMKQFGKVSIPSDTFINILKK